MTKKQPTEAKNATLSQIIESQGIKPVTDPSIWMCSESFGYEEIRQHQVTVDLSEKEWLRLKELARQLELPRGKALVQALLDRRLSAPVGSEVT